jgi:translocation and assembly module TamA
MSGRGSRLEAARLLCAAAAATLASVEASAQTSPQPPTDPAELDPNAPLAPMPDLGVAWPDLKAGGLQLRR